MWILSAALVRSGALARSVLAPRSKPEGHTSQGCSSTLQGHHFASERQQQRFLASALRAALMTDGMFHFLPLKFCFLPPPAALQVLSTGAQGQRLSAWQVAAQLWRTEGLRGFRRGMAARVLTMASGSAVSWTTYETVKRSLAQRS